MNLMLIGGTVVLIIGVGITMLYFIFAKFFAVQARALDRNPKTAEQVARQTRESQPSQTAGRLDPIDALQKGGVETAAKAGS